MAREQYYMDRFKDKPWVYVMNSMKIIGWSIERNDDRAKVLKIKNLRMVALRMGRDRWKVEVFKNRRLVDGLGINSGTEAKILMTQCGVLWGMSA